MEIFNRIVSYSLHSKWSNASETGTKRLPLESGRSTGRKLSTLNETIYKTVRKGNPTQRKYIYFRKQIAESRHYNSAATYPKQLLLGGTTTALDERSDPSEQQSGSPALNRMVDGGYGYRCSPQNAVLQAAQKQVQRNGAIRT
jgi:hypothetical protein